MTIEKSHRPAVTAAHLVAREVLAGRSVRIVGLGVLSEVFPRVARPVYRLTLTAAVARACLGTADWGTRAGLAVRRENEYMTRDARHIARALGANVEVWAPGQRGHRNGCVCEDGARLITTVHP